MITQVEHGSGAAEVGSGFDLSGQVAVVTDGGREIGREMALAPSRAGASVAVAARSAHQVPATADTIICSGGRAMALPGDVTDQLGVAQAIAMVQAKHRRLHVFRGLAERKYGRLMIDYAFPDLPNSIVGQ